jgi:nitroreductase
MNEILQSLYSRKSVRVYDDRAIDKDSKISILRAAMEAPTAGNMQMYTIIDAADPSLKERLSVLCDNQPFIAKAPLVLVFCADYQKWYDFFVMTGTDPRKPGVGDLLLACEDALIASQNTVVAAESLGIGSCYIGDIMENCEQIRELLDLPEYVYPACMVVYGYPTEQQKQRIKPLRFKLEDIVCENRYVRKDESSLRKMFSKEAPDGDLERWASAFCKRKYNSDFSIEMTRSMKKYLESFNN